MKPNYADLIFILLLISFSSQKKLKEPGLELANYNYPKSSDDQYETIAIMGTNDIHGAAYEKMEKYEGKNYQIGGYKLLSGIIDNYRREYGDNFLWFDAGDQFTGTLENSLTNGKLMMEFYNMLRPDAFAIGNHEWDKDEKWLEETMRTEVSDFLSANLEARDKYKPLPNRMSTKMFTFKNGIKIGTIGLITRQTDFTTSFPPKNYIIEEYLPNIQKYSEYLRKNGANAVLILSHVGISCHGLTPQELFDLKLRSNKDKQGECYNEELLQLLPLLKPGEIDGVIAGHMHSSVHHWHNGIPIIQNPMSGVFTNVLYLKFDKKTKQLIRDEIQIEGPIPVCSHVFEHNRRCNEYPSVSGASLVPFTLHNRKISPRSIVKALFSGPVDKQIIEAKKDVLALNQMRLERNRDEDNILGNFVCDVIKENMKTDFCVFNFGTLRATWDIGYLNVYDLFQMFPFINYMSRIEVQGSTLKKIMKTLEEGAKAFYPSSGFLMKALMQGAKRTLLDIKKADGSEIDDNKMYTLSSTDFLISGGDDWHYVKSFFTPKEIQTSKISLRDAMINKLREIKILDSSTLKTSTRLEIVTK